MIFHIKHHWRLTLGVTAATGMTCAALGAFDQFTEGGRPLWQLVLLGAAGGAGAMLFNGAVHEVLKRTLGRRYVERFRDYGRRILNGMGWREYAAGGLMAAAAEEPLFRGLLLAAFDSPALGIAVAAVVFALCHWMQARYFGFWLWAMAEGVLFGVLMVVTGSLLVPMIAHGRQDLFAYRVMAALVGREEDN